MRAERPDGADRGDGVRGEPGAVARRREEPTGPTVHEPRVRGRAAGALLHAAEPRERLRVRLGRGDGPAGRAAAACDTLVTSVTSSPLRGRPAAGPVVRARRATMPRRRPDGRRTPANARAASRRHRSSYASATVVPVVVGAPGRAAPPRARSRRPGRRSASSTAAATSSGVANQRPAGPSTSRLNDDVEGGGRCTRADRAQQRRVGAADASARAGRVRRVRVELVEQVLVPDAAEQPDPVVGQPPRSARCTRRRTARSRRRPAAASRR